MEDKAEELAHKTRLDKKYIKTENIIKLEDHLDVGQVRFSE